eukprot:scaffold9409_cov116-Isochrysis_galbana.AAC.16
MRSSTVPCVTKRKMRTGLAWPIRCTRSIACRSTCGLKSESYSTTVSAEVRVMPSPPARVEQRKTESFEPGALKALMSMVRWTRLVEPSSRAYSVPRALRNSSMRSSIEVQPEKRTRRWPEGSSSSSSASSVASLPDDETSVSP